LVGVGDAVEQAPDGHALRPIDHASRNCWASTLSLWVRGHDEQFAE
jgi:hypothetical protein